MASEFLESQRRIYAANHLGTTILPEDIRELTAERVLEAAGLRAGELDLVDGSPPCNDFSMTNSYREQGWGKEHDYQGGVKRQRVDDLFMVWLRLVDGIRPRAVVGENVPGMMQGKAKGYLEEVLRTLRSMGYRARAKLMNALYYGVAQSRPRVIIMGVREDLGKEPRFPPHATGATTLQQAVDGLGGPGRYRPLKEGTVLHALYDQCPRGKSFTSVPDARGSFFNNCRMAWDRPAPMISTVPSVATMPDEPRSLGVNELKRLFGYPDDYRLPGKFREIWTAMGMSVPPPMMAAIGRQVGRLLGAAT